MTLNEFAQCFEFNITHNIKHAVLGLGAPGVGKSQAIRQIGKKYGYKVIDVRLAQMSEVEIGGLIYPNEQRTKTIWLAPEILPDEKRDGEKTILLLDEITSCTKRVQVAAYQLILDRKIGQYTLPEGTFVVALGNREDDDGVYIQLAGPLADRFEIHYIEPDFNSWKYDYALKNDVHPYVVDYLTYRPEGLHTQKQEEDAMVFATPRSWTRVSDILKIDSNVSNPVVAYKIIGNIGVAEGNMFIKYCKEHGGYVTADEFIRGADVENDPGKLSVLSKSLVEKIRFITNYKQLAEIPSDQRAELDKVFSAIFRIPNDEFINVCIKDLLDMNRSVIKELFMNSESNEITRFIENNKLLLGDVTMPNANMANWL